MRGQSIGKYSSSRAVSEAVVRIAAVCLGLSGNKKKAALLHRKKSCTEASM